MAKERKREDRIAGLIKDVEAAAARLRAELRKRAKAAGILKRLEAAANQLRKRAAAVAGQVEKYAHDLRTELEGRPAKAAKRKARPHRAAVGHPAAS
jgi:hypothetical protein